MNPDEKIKKIREIEQKFTAEIEQVMRDHQEKMKQFITALEQEKIQNLKKDLGI